MKYKEADVTYCGVRAKKIRKAEPVLSEKAMLMLYQYIKERYKIHIRKDVEKLPKPWTTNEILLNYRFTNVRREHDTETKWLIENIATNKDLSYDDKLMNCILFRLYNKKETMELIGGPVRFEGFDPEEHRSVLETFEEANPDETLFTTAFWTSGLKRAMKKYVGGEDIPAVRTLFYAKYLYDRGILEGVKKAKNQEEAFSALKNFCGIGDFLGYQMWVDMTYIKEFPFSENEFTVAGPGCRMGLDFLFVDKDGMSYEECLFWLRDNIDEEFRRREFKWNPKKLMVDVPEGERCLNIMSLENCFCEFSKYYRTSEGISRPRKRYNGQKEGKR